MKYKSLCLVILTTLALLAVDSSASATTLEVGGVKQNAAVTIRGAIPAATSTTWTLTSGTFLNTTAASTFETKTASSFTGTTVGGSVTSWTWGTATQGTIVTDALGSLSIENISGTTNGTVRSTGTKVTVSSPLGTLTCTTSNTDIGVLTGVAAGNATLDINAVLNCGTFAPSTLWAGTFTVTVPTGLGVTS